MVGKDKSKHDFRPLNARYARLFEGVKLNSMEKIDKLIRTNFTGVPAFSLNFNWAS